MRYAFVAEINWLDFRNLMHGHSHVAMLGWLYLALFLLIVRFLVKEEYQYRHYKNIFIMTQFTVIGMAISFPIQGYGAISIVFSTLHVFLSYAFVIRFFKDIKNSPVKYRLSNLFAKTALLFMVLSTLALFTMAPIMIMDLKTSNLYYMAVQFFLHFQFNGWFIFGILALFFRLLENWDIMILERNSKYFYGCLVISCFLTYALAVTWSNPSPFLFLVNSIGVLIQLTALIYFVKIIKNNYLEIREKISKGVLYLFALSFFSFCLKIIVQFAVVIPYIATIAYTIRNYVIGFIHLILLGAITFAILALASRAGYIQLKDKTLSKGIIVLTIGIFLSEILLFLQGTLLWGAQGFIPFYYEILFGVSVLMPMGIAIMLFSMKAIPKDISGL